MPKAFERDIIARFLPLGRSLTEIENHIQRLIIRVMSGAKISPGYWRKSKMELDILYRRMNMIFGAWTKKEKAGYIRSIQAINKRIKGMRFVINQAQKTVPELLASNASKQLMMGLYSSSVESFLTASMAGRQNIRNLFIRTQQKLVEESLINVAVGTGFEMGDLREAKEMLKSIFTSPQWDIVNKKGFIQAGKFKYKPSYYAELVARSKFHQAHSQAALMMAANYDTDLIQISTHNTTTEICMEFEGKIYSISGKDKRFPPLMESPPFHPNCLHLEYPAFESGMIAQGTLASFSDFSKGKISRPPIPSAFIPIKERVA